MASSEISPWLRKGAATAVASSDFDSLDLSPSVSSSINSTTLFSASVSAMNNGPQLWSDKLRVSNWDGLEIAEFGVVNAYEVDACMVMAAKARTKKLLFEKYFILGYCKATMLIRLLYSHSRCDVKDVPLISSKNDRAKATIDCAEYFDEVLFVK